MKTKLILQVMRTKKEIFKGDELKGKTIQWKLTESQPAKKQICYSDN